MSDFMVISLPHCVYVLILDISIIYDNTLQIDVCCASSLGLSNPITNNAGLVSQSTLIDGASVDSPSSTGWDFIKKSLLKAHISNLRHAS